MNEFGVNICIVGGSVQDVKYFEFKNGKPGGVLTVNLKCVRTEYWNNDVEKQFTTWFNVKLFGQYAETMRGKILAGDEILAEGVVDTEKNPNGDTRYFIRGSKLTKVSEARNAGALFQSDGYDQEGPAPGEVYDAGSEGRPVRQKESDGEMDIPF